MAREVLDPTSARRLVQDGTAGGENPPLPLFTMETTPRRCTRLIESNIFMMAVDSTGVGPKAIGIARLKVTDSDSVKDVLIGLLDNSVCLVYSWMTVFRIGS